MTTPLRFREVVVRRLPGAAGVSFALRELSPGVNVVHGASPAGRTAALEALRLLLWPASAPEESSVAGRFDLGTDEWTVEIDGDHVVRERRAGAGGRTVAELRLAGDGDPAVLEAAREALRDLRRWLRTPGPDREVQRRRDGLVVAGATALLVVGTATALLALLAVPDDTLRVAGTVTALAALIAGVVVLLLRPRPEADRRRPIEDAVTATGRGPRQWTPAAVEARVAELEREIARREVATLELARREEDRRARAVVREIGGGGPAVVADAAALPLILDESLSRADDARTRAAVETAVALARRGRQLFCFTAQRDEAVRWREHLEMAGVDWGEHDFGVARAEGAALARSGCSPGRPESRVLPAESGRLESRGGTELESKGLFRLGDA